MKIIMLMLLFFSALFAQIKVGEGFPDYKLVDQFDKEMPIKREGNTTLILSFEKDVSSEIKKYIDTKEKNFLEKNNLMYVSDISSMPSFITSWFALPKMKKFGFRVALIYKDNIGDIIPREEGKTTVIKLDYNKIMSIDFVLPKDLDTVLE